jgi:hypothetical protein
MRIVELLTVINSPHHAAFMPPRDQRGMINTARMPPNVAADLINS